MADENGRRRRSVLRALAAVGGVTLSGCEALRDGGSGTTSPDGRKTTPGAETGTAVETSGATTDRQAETRSATATLGEPPAVEVPAESLVAEPLPVRIDGLDPGTAVELEVRPADETKRWFTWRRAYTADDAGRIETHAGATAEETAPRMVLSTLTAPEDDDLGPYTTGDAETTDLEVRVLRGGSVWTTTITTRVLQDPVIEGSTVEADDLVGTVYEPVGDGPHPPVVVLHGSEGRVPHSYCHLLATQGYLALELRYFGDSEALPDDLVEVPLEYFERAVEWLGERSAAADGGVGLVGFSRGVEPVLLTAAAVDGPVAAVGYGGSGIVHPGPNGSAAAWTRDGRLLTTAEDVERFFASMEDAEYESDVGSCSYDDPTEACGALACHLDHARTTDREAYETLMISVEDIDGPIALFSGRNGSMWPASQWSECALYRLARNDHDRPYGHYAYTDAGHYFLRPYHVNLMGGTPEGNLDASARSWTRALDALEAGLS